MFPRKHPDISQRSARLFILVSNGNRFHSLYQLENCLGCSYLMCQVALNPWSKAYFLQHNAFILESIWLRMNITIFNFYRRYIFCFHTPLLYIFWPWCLSWIVSCFSKAYNALSRAPCENLLLSTNSLLKV